MKSNERRRKKNEEQRAKVSVNNGQVTWTKFQDRGNGIPEHTGAKKGKEHVVAVGRDQVYMGHS